MSAECMPCSPNDKEKPTSRVCVSKDEAAKLSVGSDVSLHMSGAVKSIEQRYDDKEKYDIVIEDPKTEVKESAKKADDNYATMPREKLKEKIKKSDEE